MAVDKLVDSAKLDACLDAEADAIRAKTGGSADIPFDFANNKGFADAIAAIPSGGGGQGIRDLVYDHTFSGGATISGIVENNSFRLANASSSYYNIPLILYQPIALSNGDEVDITIKNPQSLQNVSVGLFTIFGRVISAREWISIARNQSITQTTTYTYEHTGSDTIIDSILLMNDGGPFSDASAELSLSINNEVIF